MLLRVNIFAQIQVVLCYNYFVLSNIIFIFANNKYLGGNNNDEENFICIATGNPDAKHGG